MHVIGARGMYSLNALVIPVLSVQVFVFCFVNDGVTVSIDPPSKWPGPGQPTLVYNDPGAMYTSTQVYIDPLGHCTQGRLTPPGVEWPPSNFRQHSELKNGIHDTQEQQDELKY